MAQIGAGDDRSVNVGNTAHGGGVDGNFTIKRDGSGSVPPRADTSVHPIAHTEGLMGEKVLKPEGLREAVPGHPGRVADCRLSVGHVVRAERDRCARMPIVYQAGGGSAIRPAPNPLF